jgi:uridylate kinase
VDVRNNLGVDIAVVVGGGNIRRSAAPERHDARPTTWACSPS